MPVPSLSAGKSTSRAVGPGNRGRLSPRGARELSAWRRGHAERAGAAARRRRFSRLLARGVVLRDWPAGRATARLEAGGAGRRPRSPGLRNFDMERQRAGSAPAVTRYHSPGECPTGSATLDGQGREGQGREGQGIGGGRRSESRAPHTAVGIAGAPYGGRNRGRPRRRSRWPQTAGAGGSRLVVPPASPA